jgi:hypothetical protein
MRCLLALCILLVGCRESVEMPASPGAVLPRDMNSRQWSEFLTQSGIQADRTVKTFTPTWTGFSVAPAGDLYYMDFGAIVAIWAGADGTGTSDATSFSIGGIPAAARPTGQRSAMCLVMDNGLEAPARVIIDTDGTAFFQRLVISGANLQYSTTAFTAANVKGLVVGAVVFYTK